jgi:hypothetical protein
LWQICVSVKKENLELLILSGKVHTSVEYYYTVTGAGKAGANGLNSLVANIATTLTASGWYRMRSNQSVIKSHQTLVDMLV